MYPVEKNNLLKTYCQICQNNVWLFLLSLEEKTLELINEIKFLIGLKMEDTFKSNVTTLKESILDEEKLITYISLSKELCIHVNEAKRLLNYVVEQIRKMEPKTEIYVCYLISGLLSDNSASTTVCSESELVVTRKTLNTIFYEHVYSVSKGMKAVDSSAMIALNKFEDFSLCTGLIKANSCSKRAQNEILHLGSSFSHGLGSESKPNVTSKNTERKRDFFKNGSESVKKTVDLKAEPLTRSKTPSPKKEASNKPSNKNVPKPISKGIAGFFNKVNGDTNKVKQRIVSEEKQENKVAIKVEKEADQTKSNSISIEMEHKEPQEKSNKTDKKEKPQEKSNKTVKKNGKVQKKRKRLLHVSDSESETEANDPFTDDEPEKMIIDHESEDEIPPTPSVNTVKITSGIINPKKKRKIVDKTYTDEDGYVLTKKEEVYESCSDNEEETKADIKQEKENIKVTQVKTEMSPKKNDKVKKKKVSPPQKGKQQTLTNFFKKV